MSKWIYQRNDAGIPGLPHEITDEEAAERGLTGLLRDAIDAGAYLADTQVRTNESANVGADVSVRPNKKAKKESEVNDG